MAEAIDLRPAWPTDAAACASIVNRWIDARDWMPRVHTPDEVVRFYERFVLPKRQLWIVGDPVAGFLALDPEAARITALYVAEPGRGIGKQLLDHAKSRIDRLELWTFVANEGARRFYAREGFREIRRTDGDNEEGLPDILLEWERRP